MQVLLYGKNGGKFNNNKGEQVILWKVSAVVPTAQKYGSYSVIGDSCEHVNVSEDIWQALPSDPKDFSGGLLCEVEFDYKGNIIKLDLV